jgi:hypothetical protein
MAGAALRVYREMKSLHDGLKLKDYVDSFNESLKIY